MSKGVRWSVAGAILLAVLALLWAGDRLIQLPEPRSAPGEFSAPRAMARLARVLGSEQPHPVDTAANDAVRGRIVAELKALGLAPVVDDGLSCNPSRRNGGLSCARVRNVRATVGPAVGRHLLVVAHYDSTPVGPGAADDGVGVASMLETAALLSRRPLARPITFLFNEGEEAGLLGARAFLSRDPLAARVDALVNLESRGVTGPAIMFETSRPNAAAVRWLGRAAPSPVANSLATDFYRLIPNSTDVRVFEERPWTILNFAIIGNETRYHSPGDTLEALDPRSVQHMGDQLLALASGYAAGGVAQAEGTRVFADLWGLELVHLPATLAFVLLGLAALALLVAAIRARAWRGAAATGAAMAGAAGLAFGAMRLVGATRAGEWWRAQPDATSLALILTALLAAAGAIALFARGQEAARLRRGFWLVLASLGAGVTWVAPGASIYFVLPPLLAAIGLSVGGRMERPLLILASAAIILTFSPLIGLVEVLLDFDNGWIFAPLYALLLAPVVLELRELARDLPRWRGLAGTAAVAALAWVAVGLRPAYSADRKQAFGVEYMSDGAASRWLVVNDGAPLPPVLGAFRPGTEVLWSTRDRWAAPALAALLPAPAAEIVAEQNNGGARRVTLRLRANGADALTIYAPPGRLRDMRAGSWRMPFSSGEEGARPALAFRCRGRSCDGLEIEFGLASRAPVELTLLGSRWTLPPAAAPFLAARPRDAAPQYDPDQSVAVTRLRV